MPSTGSSILERAVTIAKSRRSRKILWWILGLVAAFALIGFLVAYLYIWVDKNKAMLNNSCETTLLHEFV